MPQAGLIMNAGSMPLASEGLYRTLLVEQRPMSLAKDFQAPGSRGREPAASTGDPRGGRAAVLAQCEPAAAPVWRRRPWQPLR